METILIDQNDPEGMQAAGEIIRNGGLVAFPTETVYGLGANALDPVAAEKIYAAKGRPSNNPLIIHLHDASEAEKYCYTTKMYYRLAERFMPGPLTVILKKRSVIPDEITAGKDTVAVRIPSCPAANTLIRLSGCPIAAPSANISGKPSTTKVEHVIADMYGKIDAVIMGDESEIGLESTIVLPDGGGLVILRPGGVSREDLLSICSDVRLSEAVEKKYESANGPIAPGMMYKHYAPRQKVCIVDSDDEKFYDFINKKENVGVLCFDGDLPYLKQKYVFSIGPKTDQKAQAHLLFSKLRDFDSLCDIDTIFARMPSKDGLGLAVFNRLIKAAGFDMIML